MNRVWLEFWKDTRVWAVSSALVANSLLMLLVPYVGQLFPWRYAAGGVISFFFAEYVLHRFLLHGFLSILLPSARSGHDDHHREPGNIHYMLTPNKYNIPYHIALTALFSLLFGSLKLGGAFMAGFSLYQLFYEWSHFISHRPFVPLTPLGKWMKKQHLLHHHKDAARYYGVTNPLLDMTFRTSSLNDQPSQRPNKPDQSASL